MHLTEVLNSLLLAAGAVKGPLFCPRIFVVLCLSEGIWTSFWRKLELIKISACIGARMP